MEKPAGINHILLLYPFSSSADGWLRADILQYIYLTPGEQIQSASVKSNLPVNTGQPLDGADYLQKSTKKIFNLIGS